MKHKENMCTNHSVEVIDQIVTSTIQRKFPELPLERVLSLSVREMEEKDEEKEKEVLAMLDTQTPWRKYDPRRWEDLRASPELEDEKVLKKHKSGIGVLNEKNGDTFKVNGQRLKPYDPGEGGPIETVKLI
jgi:hypothetical protein